MAVCNGSQESGKTPSAALPVNGRLFALDLFLTPDYFFLSANQLTAGLIVHRSASSFPANLLQLTIFDNDWNSWIVIRKSEHLGAISAIVLRIFFGEGDALFVVPGFGFRTMRTARFGIHHNVAHNYYLFSSATYSTEGSAPV